VFNVNKKPAIIEQLLLHEVSSNEIEPRYDLLVKESVFHTTQWKWTHRVCWRQGFWGTKVSCQMQTWQVIAYFIIRRLGFRFIRRRWVGSSYGRALWLWHFKPGCWEDRQRDGRHLNLPLLLQQENESRNSRRRIGAKVRDEKIWEMR